MTTGDRKRSGFVLMLVVMTMVMIAVVALVLAETSATVLFQTDRVYLEAVRRNLSASGLAWARCHARELDNSSPDKPIDLDVSGLHLKDPLLQVSLGGKQAGIAQVRIKTLCAKGRQTLSGSGSYTIPLQ